jgi:hypothetical protein
MVADPDQVRTNIHLPSWNAGFVGMRFQSADFRNNFIPLRKVTITNIWEQDTVQVFFRLGDYVCHAKESLVLKLDNIIDLSKPEVTLFFSVPLDSVPILQDMPLSKQMPSKLWDCLVSSGVISPEAQENFLNTLVLRFCGYRLHGTSSTLPPEKIESGGERGDVFGPKLMQGKCYDFDLAYSRIMRAGGASSDIPACQYEWVPQGETLKVAQSIIPVTGNYRMETVWAEVRQSSPAPVEFRLIPRTSKEDESPASASGLKYMELRVWSLAAAEFWTWGRIRDCLVSIVFFVAIIVFFQLAKDRSAAYIALLGGSSALFASFFKDFLKGIK